MGKVVGIFAGEIRGSVGKVTFRKANGENVVSQKVTQVANPRSMGQQVQRMKMYTVIKAYSLMKNICDHSFENAKGRNGNMSMFVKKNVNSLWVSMNETELEPGTCYLDMGEQNKIAPNNYLISEGSLQNNVVPYNVQINVNGNNSWMHVIGLKGSEDAYTRDNLQDITVKELHELFGCEIGTQITICSISGYTNPDFVYSRYVFDKDSAESKVFTTVGNLIKVSDDVLDMNNTKITNGAIIGIMKSGESPNQKSYLWLGTQSGSGEEGVACSVILSSKENGAWKRSTATLQWTPDRSNTDFLPKNKIGSWKVGTKNFLNNATV